MALGCPCTERPTILGPMLFLEPPCGSLHPFGDHSRPTFQLLPSQFQVRCPSNGAPLNEAPQAPYHVPFFGYPTLVLGIYNHKVGYPQKGGWYEGLAVSIWYSIQSSRLGGWSQYPTSSKVLAPLYSKQHEMRTRRFCWRV